MTVTMGCTMMDGRATTADGEPGTNINISISKGEVTMAMERQRAKERRWARSHPLPRSQARVCINKGSQEVDQ